MTLDSPYTSLLDSRMLAYDQLLTSMKSDYTSQKKREESCSAWSKSYQADFSKLKMPKDTDLPLIFGNIEEPDPIFAITNSLARTGLGDKIISKMLATDSVDSYSILDMYLGYIRKGSSKECIEWCIQRAAELKAVESQMLISQLINLELSFAYQSSTNTLELARKLRGIRSYVVEVAETNKNFDVTSLDFALVLQKPNSENIEQAKQKAIDMFSSLFMSCMNLPRYDILKVSTNVGVYALEPLTKIGQLYSSNQSIFNVNSVKELPIQIALPDGYNHHSVYTCPVLKVQCSAANPAMRMTCGHIICKEALAKLSRGNPSLRFKCPYCPSECTGSSSSSVFY